MRYELAERLQGTRQAYWMLRILNPDRTVRAVHTSKSLPYIRKILDRYKAVMDFSL